VSNKNNLKDKIKRPNATQAFFNSYGEKEIKETTSYEKDNKDNDNIDDIYVDNDDDYLRSLATGEKVVKTKTRKKVFTSFYMDPDLAEEVNKIAARGQKGDKSKLINKAIRRLLEEYGAI
jgi:Ribbon-helix-helix protein, copG family